MFPAAGSRRRPTRRAIGLDVEQALLDRGRDLARRRAVRAAHLRVDDEDAVEGTPHLPPCATVSSPSANGVGDRPRTEDGHRDAAEGRRAPEPHTPGTAEHERQNREEEERLSRRSRQDQQRDREARATERPRVGRFASRTANSATSPSTEANTGSLETRWKNNPYAGRTARRTNIAPAALRP